MAIALRETLAPVSARPGSVTLVIVTYNSRRYLDGCLRGIAAQTLAPDEVVIVDNASVDDTVPYLRSLEGPSLRLLANGDNPGYFAGIDRALAGIDSEYVAVLNPDTLPSPGWLEPLVSFLDAHPEAGGATSRVLLTGRPDRVNALGLEIHVAGMGFNRDLGAIDTREAVLPFRVDGLHGAALVVRRELLARITPIVRDCFLYHEDVQLSLLLQLMGYDLYCVPRSTVQHDYELHMFPRKLQLLERNRLEMLSYVWQAGSYIRYAPFLLATEACVLTYCALKGPSYLRAKLAAYAETAGRGRRILQKRRLVRELRARRDHDVLPGLRKTFVMGQLGGILKQTQRRQAWPEATEVESSA